MIFWPWLIVAFAAGSLMMAVVVKLRFKRAWRAMHDRIVVELKDGFVEELLKEGWTKREIPGSADSE